MIFLKFKKNNKINVNEIDLSRILYIYMYIIHTYIYIIYKSMYTKMYKTLK